MPPSTAASSRPPRTSSTSMSTVWRRALSTPALQDGGSTAGGSGRPWGLHPAPYSKDEEEWNAASANMPAEELARLIEHVHSRVLKERRRRKTAEHELAGTRKGEG